MLDEEIIEKLMANWPLAESMACKAEVRLYDPISSWECYILAINPEDETEAKVFIVDEDKHLEASIVDLTHLLTRWNGEGELMEIDEAFVPRQASELFKTLNARYP